MNRYLKRLKETVNKLDGTDPKRDYRLLEQMDDKFLLYNYQCELEKMDFSLDKESGGFRYIATFVRKNIDDVFDEWIRSETDKYILEQRWSSDEDKNECLEIFLVRKPRRKFKIGVCAYRKGFEIAGPFVNVFGKKKMLEFHRPSKRGDVFASIISKLGGFRKEEDNLYILTLPAVSCMIEFKKQIFPKFKKAYELMHELSKDW